MKTQTTQHTPTPWNSGDYTTTDSFRRINEHECLYRSDGTVVALFGPKGHPQSVADRDHTKLAVNSFEKSLAALKAVEDYLQGVTPRSTYTESDLVGIVKAAITKMEGRS